MHLSEQAETLATRLHVMIGPGGTGIGPDTERLADLWQGEEITLLRPAIEELREAGFIDVEYIPPVVDEKAATPSRPAIYRVEDIAGIVVLEPLQNHFNARLLASRQQAM